MPRKSNKYISDKHRTRGFFDHLREITSGKDPLYWSSLTGGEKVEFQPYMINRYLSMNPDWIELVDELQRYTIGMPKDKVFELYHEIIPKGKVYLKYIKGKSSVKIPDELAEMMKRYFECSEHEMREYFVLLMKSNQGKKFLLELMQAYGTQLDELKKIRKETGI